MAPVRLASRAVVAIFPPDVTLAAIVRDLVGLGTPPIDVSILARPAALAAPPAESNRGWFGSWRRSAAVRLEQTRIERPNTGELSGAGPLGIALKESPSTSIVGALVMQGIPQPDARVYAEATAEGRALILVGVPDRVQGDRVRDHLLAAGAETARYFGGQPYGTAYHGAGPGLS